MSFSVFDFLHVLQVQLFAFFWIFWKEFVLVAERVEEHELCEIEEMRVVVELLLEKSQCPGEVPLVEDFRLSWHQVFQCQLLW